VLKRVGPGSVTTMTKMGTAQGYAMLTLLADGLGDDVNSTPAKLCSAVSLLVGMVVAILVIEFRAISFLDALVAAQAGTLQAIPLASISALVVPH